MPKKTVPNNLTTYEVALLQSKAYRSYNVRMSGALKEFDLVPPYWILLGVLFNHKEGIRFTDIADMIGVKKPLVTRMVDKFEKDGLVQRRGSSEDKRSRSVLLTTRGIKLVPKVESRLRNEMRSILKEISPKDIISYVTVLEAIIKSHSS